MMSNEHIFVQLLKILKELLASEISIMKKIYLRKKLKNQIKFLKVIIGKLQQQMLLKILFVIFQWQQIML